MRNLRPEELKHVYGGWGPPSWSNAGGNRCGKNSKNSKSSKSKSSKSSKNTKASKCTKATKETKC